MDARITELGPNPRNSLLISLLSGNLGWRLVRSGLRRQPARPVSVTHVPGVGEPVVFPRLRAGRPRLWVKIPGIAAADARFSGPSLCSAIFNIRVGTQETGSTASRDR